MGSGAIYAVIVALWAVVLVPMWLRRHDQVNESRSIDRFRYAMRTLSARREDTVESREVLMPSRRRGFDVTVTGPGTRPRRDHVEVPTSTRRAAARRRRVLLALGGLLAVVLVAALLGVLPAWTVLLPVLLVVAFLVVARRQVAAGAARRRPQRQTRARDERPPRREPQAAARPGGRVVESAPAPTGDVLVADRGDGTWEAVDAPLPTYVTAPPASRIPRVIDLTTPGSWSGAAMVAEARRARSALIAGASFAEMYVDDDLEVDVDSPVASPATSSDEFFDQMLDDDEPTLRRAVND